MVAQGRDWEDEAEANPEAESQLGMVLSVFGADRMIIGHTPSRSGIRPRFVGRLIQIDTGTSAHYGGTRSYLHPEGGRVFAVDNGVETEL